MEFWRWNPGELKMHVEKDFGRHLMKNQKMKASAIYRDRKGKIYGYDFIIPKTDRERYERLNRKYMSEITGENGAESRGEIMRTAEKIAKQLKPHFK